MAILWPQPSWSPTYKDEVESKLKSNFLSTKFLQKLRTSASTYHRGHLKTLAWIHQLPEQSHLLSQVHCLGSPSSLVSACCQSHQSHQSQECQQSEFRTFYSKWRSFINIELTVKPSSTPSHSPEPMVVFLVQESNPPQTPNMQSELPRGSHPSNALARELLP